MSRLYFASPTGGTEIAGAERQWLRHLAISAAMPAWDLDSMADTIDRAATIIGLIPEVPDGPHGANYLHRGLRDALARKAEYYAEYRRHESAGVKAMNNPAVNVLDPEQDRMLIQSLKTRLRSADGTFVVGDRQVECGNVTLNTALAVGSDPIRLAAKLSGWTFTFTEGPDRAWLAGVIDQGRAAGMYRSGMGWEDAVEFLRANASEPVVMYDSVGESFPTQDITDWSPPALSDDWRPEWADQDEWATMGQEERDECRKVSESDAWYDLPHEERFGMGIVGMRQRRPWARLAADTLGEYYFGPVVTIYHLLADGRDELVRSAVAESV